MLERLVGFVGFHGSALIAVFSRALPPLIYVELEFFPFGLRVRMFFFCGGERGARAAEHRVGVLDAFRESFEFRAQSRDALIEPLQFKQLRNRRIHATGSLAHGEKSLWALKKKTGRELARPVLASREITPRLRAYADMRQSGSQCRRPAESIQMLRRPRHPVRPRRAR